MELEKLFMSAGVISAIVLCLVGIIKSPFGAFKEKCPKGYKAVFTCLSIVISAIVTVVETLYISMGNVYSMEFAVKITFVIAGVFCGYGGIYEGLGLKDLAKALVGNINKALETGKKQKEETKPEEEPVDIINEV